MCTYALKFQLLTHGSSTKTVISIHCHKIINYPIIRGNSRIFSKVKMHAISMLFTCTLMVKESIQNSLIMYTMKSI